MSFYAKDLELGNATLIGTLNSSFSYFHSETENETPWIPSDIYMDITANQTGIRLATHALISFDTEGKV